MEANESDAQVLDVSSHLASVFAATTPIRYTTFSFDPGLDTKRVSKEEFARRYANEAAQYIFSVKSERFEHAAHA